MQEYMALLLFVKIRIVSLFACQLGAESVEAIFLILII